MITSHEQLYRLLSRFEQGPVKVDGVMWPRTPEGAALKAYLCPAGKWTIAFGCTKHPGGEPIREEDTIGSDDVYQYTSAAVQRVLSDIERMVTRPLNTYQLAALGSFVFNLGGENLRTSPRLLPAINAGRWEDAADIMGDYYRAWGKKQGKWHRMAMFGLRIRRFAEGCLLLGLDWETACDPDNVSFPKKIEWQPDWSDGMRTGGRFFDVVQPEATPFSVIHQLALSDPLPALSEPAHAQVPVLVPAVLERVEVAPAPIQDSPLPDLASQAKILKGELRIPLPGEFGEEELVLEQTAASATEANSDPAGSVEFSARAGAPKPVTLPPSPPASAPLPLPRSAPMIPAEKPKAPPVEVDTSRLRTDSMRVDAKPMEFSDRAAWFAVKLFGFWLKIMAGRGAIPLTAVSYYFQFFEDPFLSSVVISGGAWLAGECVERFGAWKLKLHRSTASTALV